MRDLQAAQLHMQAQTAAQMHQDLSAIGFGLDDVNDGLIAVQEEMAAVNAGMDRLQTIAQHTEQALYDMHTMLDGWLAQLSGQLLEQQETMTTISEDLLRPLEVQVQELRRHADHALESGMASTGSARAEWYGDAMELLAKAVDNPVGKQDYVAWFQIGWLRWKLLDDVAAAEEAFARAARLARPAGDVVLVESLRHLAYMQYLQGNHPGALQTINSALDASADAETVFDAARYEAVNDDPTHALELLEQSIRSNPPMIIRMLSEPDFGEMTDALAELVDRLSREARQKGSDALDAWVDAAGVVSEAIRIADHGSQDGVDQARGEITALRNGLSDADYLQCLVIGQQARDGRAGLLAKTIGAMEQVRDARQREVNLADASLSSIKSQGESSKRQATIELDAKKEETKRQLDTPPKDLSGQLTAAGCLCQFSLSVLLSLAGMTLDIPWMSGFWGVLLALVVGFPLAWILLTIWTYAAKANADSRAQLAMQTAWHSHAAQLAASDRATAANLAAQQEEKGRAVVHLQMVERALATLNAEI